MLVLMMFPLDFTAAGILGRVRLGDVLCVAVFRLTSPLLLVVIAACAGACYIISIKNAEHPVVFMGECCVGLVLSV